MKMRHESLGYSFGKKSESSSGLNEPLNKSAEHKSGDDIVGENEVDHVEGPNNYLGLKTIFLHPFSILLLALPFGLLAWYFKWGDGWVFWLNLIALIPLAKILGDATEELAASLHNDTVSGLLNASFGNAVEMIVSIQSIRADLFGVVKASLLGSVISNILLVLGSSFFLGGISKSSRRRGRFHSFNAANTDEFANLNVGMEKEQKFAVKSALISMGLLLFACMSFALPSIFNAMPTDDSKAVLQVSRIGACIVASAYVGLLIFQLWTHKQTLDKEEEILAKNPGEDDDEDDEEEEEEASITATCAIALMACTTLVVAVCSELLVDSIQSVVAGKGIPESFIGVILLPIAGNACEHAGALRFAWQDRPGLAIGIAVGSSTQIALLVVPFSILVAWYLDKPLDLDFGVLNTSVVTLSVLVVLTLLLDGRSNWLKGYILVCLYVFIAVLYWYLPAAMQAH